MKTCLLLITVLFYSFSYAQTTSVPDSNFENYLETHDENGNLVTLGDPTSMGDGILNNNLVLTANINTVTDLEVNNLNIADLTGIEDFLALTFLNCRGNQLVVLNVTANTALVTLWCPENQLTSLNVSSNTALVTLWCSVNQLTVLDLSANIALVYLTCANNLLTFQGKRIKLSLDLVL